MFTLAWSRGVIFILYDLKEQKELGRRRHGASAEFASVSVMWQG